MGTHSTPAPRRESNGEQSVTTRLASLFSAVTRRQTRALFFVVLLLGSVVAPFAPIGNAAAATGDIAAIAPSSDGSQLVFLNEDGGQVKTEPNPLSNSITGVDVTNGSFVVFHHNQSISSGEVGVYDFSMNQLMHDGSPTVDSNTGYGADARITDDGSHVLWSVDGTTSIYDVSSGSVVAEKATESPSSGDSIDAGENVWVARSASDSTIVNAFDYSGNQQWSIDVDAVDSGYSLAKGIAVKEGGTRSEDVLFVGQYGVGAFDPTENTQLWYNLDGSEPQNLQYHAASDTVSMHPQSTSYSTFVDAGTGAKLADTSGTGSGYVAASENNARFMAVNSAGDIALVNGDNYETASTVTPTTAVKNDVEAVPGGTYAPVTSGKVVDQDGDPVAGATVEIWAVDNSTVSGTTYDERVQELNNIANDPLPSGFEQQGGADFDVKSEYENQSNQYPLVHHESAYTDAESTYLDAGTEISSPVVQAEPGEIYQISIWDPSKDSEAAGPTKPEPPVDGQLPGATASGNVTIEKIGPLGSVQDSVTVETTPRFETSTKYLDRDLKTHETVEFAFDEGVYRVGVVGSDAQYYVVAGNPGELAASIRQNAESEAGGLTERSEMIQNRLQNESFTRTTVQAGPDGEWEAAIPPRYAAVKVQAYSDTGKVVSEADSLNMTVDNLIQHYDSSGYNGSVYLPGEVKTVDPPSSGVTVSTVEATSPEYDLGNGTDRIKELLNLTGAENFAELKDLYENPTEVVDENDLKERYNATVGLIEGTPLETAFKTLAEEQGVSTEISPDQSRETLEAQIGIAEEVIATANTTNEPPTDSPIDPTDGDTEIDPTGNDTVDVSIPTDLDGKSVTVLLDNSTSGNTSVVPSENVTRDKGTFGPDTINVDLGFNSSDIPSKTVRVVTVDNSTGNVAEEEVRVKNPGFSGEVPGLESVQMNTQRPAAGDVVTVDATGGDGFRSVNDATVYGPSGSTVPATVENGTVQFTPSSAGQHTVQLGVQSTSGHNVTETVRVKAVEERIDMPPTVRMTSGPTGQFAVASDGVSSAAIEKSNNGQTIDVTARFQNGEVPDDEVHVQGLESAYAAQNYNVRVVDETGSTLTKAVKVAVHTRSVEDGAHVRVGGEPVPVGASNAAGEVERAGGGMVVHAIAENGGVSVSVDNNPGIWDRMAWFVETTVPLAMLSVFAFGLLRTRQKRRESRVTGVSDGAGE